MDPADLTYDEVWQEFLRARDNLDRAKARLAEYANADKRLFFGIHHQIIGNRLSFLCGFTASLFIILISFVAQGQLINATIVGLGLIILVVFIVYYMIKEKDSHDFFMNSVAKYIANCEPAIETHSQLVDLFEKELGRRKAECAEKKSPKKY